jgi:hypothetical protein
MSKWQIICPLVALMLAAVIFGNIHSRSHRRALVSAVTEQLDSHATQIGDILTTMRGSNVTLIEDAAYRELQSTPSTSLISRSMIRVAPAEEGSVKCFIDTRSLGVPPRTIQSSH